MSEHTPPPILYIWGLVVGIIVGSLCQGAMVADFNFFLAVFQFFLSVGFLGIFQLFLSVGFLGIFQLFVRVGFWGFLEFCLRRF